MASGAELSRGIESCAVSLDVDSENVPVGARLFCSAAVPFCQGQVRSSRQLILRNANDDLVSVDLQVTMRWLDGSIRWVLAHWIREAGMNYRFIVLDSDSKGVFDETADGQSNDQTSLIEGGFQVGCLAGRASLVDGNGFDLMVNWEPISMVREGQVTSEYSCHGLCVNGAGRNALELFAHVMTIDALGVQRWALTIRNPRAARHRGGIWELGDRNSQLLRSAMISIEPTASKSERLKSNQTSEDVRVHLRCESRMPWMEYDADSRIVQLGSGGANYRSPVHRDQNGGVPVSRNGYVLVSGGEKTEGQRSEPLLIAGSERERSLGVCVPRFWQTFPRGLASDGRRISVTIFPEEFGATQEIQPGEQTTIEFWVAIGGTEAVRQQLELLELASDPVVQPEWVSKSGAIPWLTARTAEVSSENAEYLALIDQTILGPDTFFDKREYIDQYGWRNFGEVFGDHEAAFCDPSEPLISHYNNQYDVVYGLGLQYLRGGDARYLELMKDLARHVIDIDIYHTDEDLACYNHGLFWHSTHYVDAGTATHRSYRRGTCGGGPSSGHAYSRGLLLYYCLTGDPTASQAVRDMAEWMIAAEDGSKTKYRWLAGGETGLTSASGSECYHGPGRGPGNAVDVLLVAFELTQQRRYLQQAEHLIRRVIHPSQNPQSLDLLDAENKWFYLMFLQALGQYLEVKIGMGETDGMYSYAKASLLRYADWMVDQERPFLADPARLEYPNETWIAQDIRKVDVLHLAAMHAQHRQRERYLERARWFFSYVVKQLSLSGNSSYCRPMAILLSSGYGYDFFQGEGLKRLGSSPPLSTVDFGEPIEFVSQKVRAVRNLKRISTAVGLMILLGVFGGLAFFVG